MASKKYEEFFNIDKEFFPTVTEELIKKGTVKWQKFYPHATFIQLLEKTHDILSGRERKSIWIEGAYGTGKSHAVLTVKSILEADDDEVEEYFNEFKLNTDLRDKLIADKNNGDILIASRTGASNIRNDNDLIWAIQESIVAALNEYDIINMGEESLKNSALRWLNDSTNREYFDNILKDEKYAWFDRDGVDEYIQILQGNNTDDIAKAMKEIQKIAIDRQIYAMQINIDDLKEWIDTIIGKNKLSSILFIWDEFSEYFLNNQNSLTGFQNLVEMSNTTPFYFMIVTHKSDALFDDSKSGRSNHKKIMDRFANPIQIILPENMAFQLMAQAMRKTSDKSLEAEWNEVAEELNDELEDVRKAIKDSNKKRAVGGEKTIISDSDLENIVPIHPYAALVLKNLAVMFRSNQRSMFDFIINEDKYEKGFKWYIKNYGPYDNDNRLLTVDLLWDFFNLKGKTGITNQVKNILDSYYYVQEEKLSDEERKVFKTVLILEAIFSQADGVEILRPSEKNIDLAFIGTDWTHGQGKSIADKLNRDGVLAVRTLGGIREYTAARNTEGGEDIEKIKAEVEKKIITKQLAVNGKIIDVIPLKAPIKRRYIAEITDVASFNMDLKKLHEKYGLNLFKILVTVAKNDIEAQDIRNKISNAITNGYNDIIYIDTSVTPFGRDLLEQYIENSAYSQYYAKSDKKRANDHDVRVKQNLQKWQDAINAGAFKYYDAENANGKRLANREELYDVLFDNNIKVYPCALEKYKVPDTVFTLSTFKQGAECGINQVCKGAFGNKLGEALDGAWNIDRYWADHTKSNLVIVRLKNKVDEFISNELGTSSGRVSINKLYDSLADKPFGILPTGLTAFVLGFVLKEYANGNYFWSNGSITEALTVDKISSMIKNIISYKASTLDGSSRRYDDEYIVEMSIEQRKFLECASIVFGIPSSLCSNIEQSITHIRTKMKNLIFPIWCTEYVIDKDNIITDKKIVVDAIDKLCLIANTANARGITGTKSANEYAEMLGKSISVSPNLITDLKNLITDENCRKGMIAYVSEYNNGELKQLAEKIGDHGSYINQIKTKFSSEAANWLWNRGTADEKINNVILEYKIIDESNKYMPSEITFINTINEWKKRLNGVKLPYSVISDKVGDMDKLLVLFRNIKRNGNIIEQEKEKFYNCLVEYGERFDEFYHNQFKYFKEITSSIIKDLDDVEKEHIFAELSGGNFASGDRTEFFTKLENQKKNHLENQAKQRLKNIWKEKTGTNTPKLWSEKYNMPIFCMFNKDEFGTWKKVLNILSYPDIGEEQINFAINKLLNTNIYDRLSDEKERDKYFMENIVGEYAILLDNPEEIRNELASSLAERPYYWMDNYKKVQYVLRNMADKEYKLKGYSKVKDVISNMDADTLRSYLEKMIEKDIAVGMAILRSK